MTHTPKVGDIATDAAGREWVVTSTYSDNAYGVRPWDDTPFWNTVARCDTETGRWFLMITPELDADNTITFTGTNTAEIRLKAQRLDDVHAWLLQRFMMAYRQGDYINEEAAIKTLYLIETGNLPQDHEEDVERFRNDTIEDNRRER